MDASIRASILQSPTVAKWAYHRIKRYKNCGQEVVLKDAETGKERTERHFCGNALYCPTCQRIQALKHRRSIEKDIPKIEAANHERVQRILPTITRTQSVLSYIREELQHKPSYGSIGFQKDIIRASLADAIDDLKSLSDDIRLKEIRVALNGLREHLRASGWPSGLEKYIDTAKTLLEDELNYKWQHIVLTVRTPEGQYWRALEVLKKCLPQFRRSMLKGSGSNPRGGFDSIEVEGAVHVHTVYFGPFINQRKVKEKWRSLTAAAGLMSYEVKVDEVYDKSGSEETEKALKEGIKYAVKMAGKDPEQILDKAALLSGKKRFQRWGSLRGFGKRKKKKGEVIGERSCPDGGKDVIRDTRPIRENRIHEYFDLKAL